MIDFMKAFPSVTRDEYMWEWTVPQIELAAADNTHLVYLSEDQARRDKLVTAGARDYDPDKMISDLGIPIFKKK